LSRQVEVMVNTGQGFGAQLRGQFENLFRAILVAKNFYDLITVSVPQEDAIFQRYRFGAVYPESRHTKQVRLNRYINANFQHRDRLQSRMILSGRF
jgi:hypothetical protein